MLKEVRNARMLLIVMFFVFPLLMSGLNRREQIPDRLPAAIQDTPVMNSAAVPQETKGPRFGEYTVKDGDNLGAIAAQYNIDVDTLLGCNPGIDELIRPGDRLVIPSERGVMYQISWGDTLGRIAEVFGVDIDTIRTANGLIDDQIVDNQRLFLPGVKPARYAMAPSRRSIARFIWPTNGDISSRFGYRWGRMHTGVDIANDAGTQVHTAADGRVSYAGWYGGYGNTVIVEHGHGFMTLYGHLNEYYVHAGQYVSRGESIAAMGSTGYSTGPHLHFEIRKDDEPVNPLSYLP